MTVSLADKAVVRQFLVFAGVGAVGTAVQYAVLIVWTKLNGSPVVGSTVGFIAGAVVNYLLNYRLTFRSTMDHSRTAPRFATIALSALVLNSLLMWLLIERFAMNYLLAQTLVTGVVLVWNYAFSRLWTFSD